MAGRWGSFISGLESKLDTILADEDSTSKSKDHDATSDQAKTRVALAVPAAPKGSADRKAAYWGELAKVSDLANATQVPSGQHRRTESRTA